MKKLLQLSAISAATILLLNTTSFAGSHTTYKGYKGEAPCPQPAMLMDGFYVGAQTGYDSYRVRGNVNIGTDPGADTDTANPAINATGWMGGLFAGYGRYLSDYFYLGAELLANYSGAQSSYSIDDYNHKFNAYGTWGLVVIPGLRLSNESRIYLRLGYNTTRMKVQESLAGVASSSTNKWSGGFAYGLGLETLIVNNWSVRTEFNHVNNSSFSTSTPFNTSINPSDNQFTLGVVYHIA